MDRSRTEHGTRIVLLVALGYAAARWFARTTLRCQIYIRPQQFVHVRYVSYYAVGCPMEHLRPGFR